MIRNCVRNSVNVTPVSGMERVNIKEKLDAYRRQKRREEMIESIKSTIQNVLPWNGNKTVEDPLLVALPSSAEVRLCYS